MRQSDLEFVTETLLLTIENGGLDGLQIMFNWGVEVMGGDSYAFVEMVQRVLTNQGKEKAIGILQKYINTITY